MEKVKELLDAMKEELPGFVASALVEREEGLTVAEAKRDPDYDIAITSAYSVELMRAQERSLLALGEPETDTEMLGITPRFYFFTAPIQGTSFYLHVVLTREKGTLGLLFAYLKKYSRLLSEALAQWQSA
ncbi:MAG: hypothetical protein ABIM88_04980 [candidate division WOR-3 bacterium]